MNNIHNKNDESEFKQSSAKLAIGSQQSIAQIARELGVPKSTLRAWINKYLKTKDLSVEKLQQELNKLTIENAMLKNDRDLLKFAAAYFAHEVFIGV